jgi:hypothetical protein
MRTVIVGMVLLSGLFGGASGQTALSHTEIYQGIYGSHYDPKTKMATWHCPQEEKEAADGCMYEGDSISPINFIKAVQIEDGESIRMYVATSASGHTPDCHACAPMVGLGIFAYRKGHWTVESSGTMRAGAWGQPPPDIEVVQIGPQRYGFMFSMTDGGQGYLETSCQLYGQSGQGIAPLWTGKVWEDNRGAYDPTDKSVQPEHVQVSGAYRFVKEDTKTGYYNLEVLSRGRGFGSGDKLRSQTWSETYRFKGSKYELVRRTEFRELPIAKR